MSLHRKKPLTKTAKEETETMPEALPLTNPELVKLWDTQHNTVDMNTVSKGSTKKAWWKCEKDHSWEANIASLVRGTRCPTAPAEKPSPASMT